MLKNAYLLAKIGADTAENERHFAENLPKIPPACHEARGEAGAAAAVAAGSIAGAGGEKLGSL